MERSRMSLKEQPIGPIPEATALTARAAFPKGNPCLTLRDHVGTIFCDEFFIDLFPKWGQQALPPWRLALITVLQFAESLSDRQAAEAVRARIDWKYLLGLELTDPGFDFSVLSEFRLRLVNAKAEERLLSALLDYCRGCGLVKARGRQRTDATHVISAVRELNRLELVAETLRAALNELAVVDPEWLQSIAPAEWYKRYGRRIEDSRLPSTEPKRQAYAQTIGEDGFFLLDQIEILDHAEKLHKLSKIQALKIAWRRHYQRDDNPPSPGCSGIRFKTNKEVTKSPEKIESPYDIEVRYRTKRDLHWTGYMVHFSETCDDNDIHLITHVHTTTADEHDIKSTKKIQDALVKKGLAPKEHLVDSAYIDADLLVSSQIKHGIDLVGPPRENVSWQSKIKEAYDLEKFIINWNEQHVVCPNEKKSSSWKATTLPGGQQSIEASFKISDCKVCASRDLCTKAKVPRRSLKFPPQKEYEAQRTARARLKTKEGKHLYGKRAGVEGTISQGVRSCNVRQARYRGLAKTHMQQIASAAAMNLNRLAAWLHDVPQAKTRTSAFSKLNLAVA